MKYILPLYGAGLWGPIWGYVSLDEDKNTIYGTVFDHQGETPGLGAEITTPHFQTQFQGKLIFDNDRLVSILVKKAAMPPERTKWMPFRAAPLPPAVWRQ